MAPYPFAAPSRPQGLPTRAAGSPTPATGDGDLATTLVLAVVGTFVGVSLVFGLAARLAALVFGAGRLPVPLSQAGEAFLHLPGHWGDPAAAWPEPARSSLPGPIAFYACLLVVAVGIATPVVSAFVWWRRRTGRSGHPLGVTPHTGFARPRDLKRLSVPAPQPSRVTIGRAGRRLLACEPQASLAVFGPTGAGKTIGFAAPALLEWEGPVIATSVKADLLSATLEHRRSRGTVWIYDPTGAAGLPPEQTAGWSPVSACGTWAGALRIAAWLAEAAQPRLDTVADGDYWYTQARKGLAPYLHAAALGGKTIRDVIRWVDTQDDA